MAPTIRYVCLECIQFGSSTHDLFGTGINIIHQSGLTLTKVWPVLACLSQFSTRYSIHRLRRNSSTSHCNGANERDPWEQSYLSASWIIYRVLVIWSNSVDYVTDTLQCVEVFGEPLLIPCRRTTRKSIVLKAFRVL